MQELFIPKKDKKMVRDTIDNPSYNTDSVLKSFESQIRLWYWK